MRSINFFNNINKLNKDRKLIKNASNKSILNQEEVNDFKNQEEINDLKK